MDFITQSPSIDVIIGPMFSGKTTELHRRLNICVEADYKVMYINSVLDTRDGVLSTHNTTLKNTEKINYMKTSNLLDLFPQCLLADVIGVDEAQFFPDLFLFCRLLCEDHHKKIIVSGLNGDFQRKPFGQINDLITICDTVTKLNAFCYSCRKSYNRMTPALFSKRICDTEQTVLVGGAMMYIPVCRTCYK